MQNKVMLSERANSPNVGSHPLYITALLIPIHFNQIHMAQQFIKHTGKHCNKPTRGKITLLLNITIKPQNTCSPKGGSKEMGYIKRTPLRIITLLRAAPVKLYWSP